MTAVIIPAPAQIPASDPATVITGALVSAVAVIPLLSVVGGLALILTRWVSDQHTPVPAPARRRLLLAVSAWGAATVVSTCIATQNGFSTPGGVLLAALALWSVYASARTGYLLCAARQENQGLLHLQGAPRQPGAPAVPDAVVESLRPAPGQSRPRRPGRFSRRR